MEQLIKKITFFLVLFLYVTIYLNGQIVEIKGYVVDDNTGKGLAYANIMVLHCAYGATSDKNGYFELELNKNLINDTLVISYVGYQSIYVSANKIGGLPIRLLHQTINLNEVIVLAEVINTKEKITIINKFKKRKSFLRYAPIDSVSRNNWLPTRPEEPAIEAIFFPNMVEYNKKNKVFEVWISISSFSIPSTFRLRILEATKNKKPGKDLLSVPLIIKSTESKQLIKINLEQYNISIYGDGLFVGIELLIIPDNCSIVDIDNHKYTLYSPYLNYINSEESGQSWIYTKGSWKTNNQKTPTSFTGKASKNMYYKPAISLVLN